VIVGAPEPRYRPKPAVVVARTAADPPAVMAVALIAVTVPDVTAVVNDPAALVVPPMTVLSIVPPERMGSLKATPTEILFGISFSC